MPARARERAEALLWLIPALALYALFVLRLEFVQDDAFISFRYVANFLNGHGLVYNIGERVEGYTSPGWVVLLSLAGALGFDYPAVARFLGILCGAGLPVLAWAVARRTEPQRGPLAAAIPAYLVAATASLAYWAAAGLETTAFALAAGVSLYGFLVRRVPLLAVGLVWAVWLRSEGAVVAAILIAVETLVIKRFPRMTVAAGALAFVLSLPMVAFKLGYYGALPPNSFYAKTGWDFEQIRGGAEYAGQFFTHYPVAAFGLLAGLVTWRASGPTVRAIGLFSLFYVVYVILIGGDVLKVHRFFLPILGPLMVAAVYGAAGAVEMVARRRRRWTGAAVAAALAAMVLTWLLPRAYIENYRHRERMFVARMTAMAEQMKATDPTDFSVALSTIGAFGYTLTGHRVIDMLGLTDSAVARHPEPIPEGIESTWRERSFNCRYLLSQGPDYILFSTNNKPSAPAELVLTLYPQFQRSYRAVGWHVPGSGLQVAFRRQEPITGALKPAAPAAFALAYKRGLEQQWKGDLVGALNSFDQALAVSPPPYYLDLVFRKALCHRDLGQMDEALRLLQWIVAQDPRMVDAQRELYMIETLRGNPAQAAEHRAWVEKMTPWEMPGLDSAVAEVARSARRTP